MFRKTVSAIMLSLLVISTLTLVFKVQTAKADGGTININADGSITPSTAPIYSSDNVTYTLTGNITAVTDGIVIERDNIVLNGAGFTVAGNGTGNGIDVSNRTNVTIENTNVENFDYGMYLENSANETVIGNNITGNNQNGIHIYSPLGYTISEDNISENNITNNEFGISLVLSTGNIISENAITNNEYGVLLQSLNNTITGNNIAASEKVGIWVWYSTGNSISENNITTSNEFYYGIYLIYSSGNSIFENNIKDNGCGIHLESSNYTSISGNTFTNGGLCVDNSYQNSVENNTVNGRPLIYLEGVLDYTVDDGGQVVLVSCEGITVEGCDLSGTDDGIELLETNSSNILGNNITNNEWVGIWLASSSNNIVSGNNITANDLIGLYLTSSSLNNKIFHNNFINNHNQVIFNSPSIWDDGYPSGGNYWSSYNGIDLYSGPYQNITGSDGIDDTPYVIDLNNVDHYPLMSPSQYVLPPVVGDLNGDGKVGLDDLVLLAKAYGSKPGEPNWNPNADIDGSGQVDLADLVSLAMHYNQHYP